MTILDDLHQEHLRTARLLESFWEIFNSPDLEVPGMRDSLAYNAAYFIDAPDDIHHCKERILYRQLQLRLGGYCQKMPHILSDHRRWREMRGKMVRVLNRILEQGRRPTDNDKAFVQQYIAGAKEQMEKEESRLFPLARSFFKPEDWATVEQEAADFMDSIQLARFNGDTPKPTLQAVA